MEVSLVSAVFAILVCLVSSEVDDCECVHPSQCLNGVAAVTAQGPNTNQRTAKCRGIEVCCFRTTRTRGPNQPGSNPEANDSPYPPIRPQKQGCGVRRLKGISSQVSSNAETSHQHFVRTSDDDLKANTDSFYGELPWLVRIYVNGKFECGGVLVSSKAVLTAAHCLRWMKASNLKVEVGEWNSIAPVEPAAPQKQNVIHISSHQQYNPDDEISPHDIALLFVKNAFKYTAAVDYICLPESLDEVNLGDCYAAGWGLESKSDRNFSPIPRKVAMPILNKTVCEPKVRSPISPNFELGPGFVCTGWLEGQAILRGDGGGPVYCSMKTEPERYAAIGIISWRLFAPKGFTTVSVSIPSNKNWINKELKNWNVRSYFAKFT